MQRKPANFLIWYKSFNFKQLVVDHDSSKNHSFYASQYEKF